MGPESLSTLGLNWSVIQAHFFYIEECNSFDFSKYTPHNRIEDKGFIQKKRLQNTNKFQHLKHLLKTTPIARRKGLSDIS